MLVQSLLKQTSFRTGFSVSSKAPPTRQVGEHPDESGQQSVQHGKDGESVQSESIKNTNVNKNKNKIYQALTLPKIANINPRSIYSKIDEFQEFVKNSGIDIIFLSESWERENADLSKIVKLDGYQVVSNVYQRKERGGRPALIINAKNYIVKDLTNKEIQIKWGVEAVWALLTPKNISPSSKIQHIACAAIYSKPNSKSKFELYEHIDEVFHKLSSKYQRGLHFIIAGDTNELNLDPILSLNHKFQQVVKQPTRIDPKTGRESLLDPVITSLSAYYQEPECIDPLDVDSDKKEKNQIIKLWL